MEIFELLNRSLVLKIGKSNLLLDCNLDLKGLLEYTPASFSIPKAPIYPKDWIETLPFIDAILISNTTKIRALPFFEGFTGKILMTDPVSKIGFSVCEELVEQDQEFRRKTVENTNLYTKSDIFSVWNQVITLAYKETFQIKELLITPLSSGHSIGAANWMIEWGNLRIGICCESSLDGTRYPSPFDPIIKECDYLIFSPWNTSKTRSYNSKALQTTVLETCKSLPITGSVLIPIDSWQVLELENIIITQAFAFNMPVVCMGLAAQAYMSYVAGSVDWLSPELIHRAYLPRNCFMFELARDKKVMSVYPKIEEAFSLPVHCFILVSHSSLRLGESDYLLMELAEKGKLHYMLKIDPDFDRSTEYFEELGLMNHFMVNKEWVVVGLSVENVKTIAEGVSNVVLPESYEGLVKGIFYKEKIEIALRPHRFEIRGNLEEPAPVKGKIGLRDYKLRAYFSERASTLKNLLKDLGYEAILTMYSSYSVINVMGGKIIFRGRKTEVRGKSQEIRSILHSFLSLNTRN